PLRMQHGLRELPIDRRVINPDSRTVLLRTDERGYILPSRRFDKPDATIVFLGGSTTECLVVDEELRFPALVSKLLEAKGLRVDTLNAGLSGNTTHDELNLLLNHVDEDKPDVAVLMEAANDAGVLLQDGSYRSRSGGLLNAGMALRWPLQLASSRLWLAGALRSYLTIGSAELPDLHDPKAEVELPAAPPEEYVKRLRAFVGLCRAFGIEPVLMTQPSVATRTPLTPRWVTAANQALFNDEMRRVAKESDVVLIDLARHLAEDVPGWEEPMKIFYDGLHVTADGSRVYAEYITQRLLETALRGRGEKTPGGVPR
ncbi:MAG TPA: SGNH/GDSL hydrolase family protein, partial [Myxococcota bacterium]|nr:SGNH/GDSL hydrolase family protein [Myxococcota bacterium]